MAYTDSEPAVTELDLRGVWLHFPDDDATAQATIRSFPYGASQRDDSLDTLGEANYYAGRQDPVVDYGEHVAEVVGVTIDVPHGTTYREALADLDTFARGKRTIHFRDNRGREVHGQMADLKRKDMDWGTQVSFTITRSAWDVETVA